MRFFQVKLIKKLVLLLLSAFCLAHLILFPKAYADNIRKPVWAGKFYPANRTELEQTIDLLTQQAKETRVQLPAHKRLRALIMPHAGYIYSGLTDAHASLVLKEKEFAKVILIGPDHRIGFQNGAISDVKAYQTPLGLIKLHRDAEKLRNVSNLFRAIPASDRSEHSVEVILPFLQRYLKDFELIPIVVGSADPGQLTEPIEPFLDQNTLLVASSDLSHNLPYSEAVSRDKETINMILNLEFDQLAESDNRACGKVPILIVINLARRYNWKPVLLYYSNSGDTAGSRERVVGYTALAFYGESLMKDNNNSAHQLTKEQGQALVKLARKTLMERFGKKVDPDISDSLAVALKDSCFQDRRGTFVTLTINGQLRGCIGNLSATESILEGVRRNALNAAFHDYRFSPLTEKELDRVDIEISILTEPKPLEYLDSSDLLKKLRVNVDGVIIRKGTHSATFLPQVWEQLPRPEDFLNHLCAKAGLPTDAWRKTGLEVMTYQVQYFEEEK